ncbi:MAG: flagellar motor protein MotD [Marinobacter sp.]|uniref:flagellar motor protein MotD n=1 Tax=Marinobacter sp. TaxID=50741 RepID=UPI00299F2B42|nr:flagellar motor protein MotD [Marinobacter sp.]MDX1756662.1 flagellar motor protein MotD [Marinobacter sp.]
MKRLRHTEEDSHNKERWLVSYADFITLLFGFFVVMYSVSSVNEGKYKVLSDTLTGVFNAPQRSLDPIEVGEQTQSAIPADGQAVIPPPVTAAPSHQQDGARARTASLRAMSQQLALEFDELIQQGVVTMETSDEWLELSLRNSLLFSSGDAEPHYDAFPVVEKIAGVLRDTDNAIRVEGFTDNLPIGNAAYPSNWELSTARASAVVRMLAMEGIAPARMAAVGYGAHQPVARNDTEEGRKRNRRVVLLISRDASIRGAMR